jgi:hypothetical protein
MLAQRFDNWESQRQKKLEIKRLEKGDPDDEELTFRPATGRPEEEPRRTHEEFLRDQEAYVQKIRKKQQALAEQSTAESTGKPSLLNPAAKKQKGDKPVHERLYSLGQLQLAKQQQAATMRDEELAQPLTSPEAPSISARKQSAAPDSNGAAGDQPAQAGRPLPPPGEADLQDPRVVRTVEELKQLQERLDKKAAEEEEKNKALQDHRNKNKSIAEKMTTEKFKKDFEQVMADMKESEDWKEGDRINFE